MSLEDIGKGRCPNCGRIKKLRADGCIPIHSYPQLGKSNLYGARDCAGSGKAALRETGSRDWDGD